MSIDALATGFLGGAFMGWIVNSLIEWHNHHQTVDDHMVTCDQYIDIINQQNEIINTLAKNNTSFEKDKENIQKKLDELEEDKKHFLRSWDMDESNVIVDE